MAKNWISDDGLDVLIQELPASVVHLDLDNNKIGLARGLSLLRFEKLSLMGNTLSLGGPHVIAASLANPDCRLEELDLYETNMETREWQPSNKPGEQSQTYSHIIGT